MAGLVGWRASLLALALLSACGGAKDSSDASSGPELATGESRELTDGWFEVRPEPSLSLKLRDGWNANRAQDNSGPIIFTGPKNARVVVWPMFVLDGAKMPSPESILIDFAQKDGGAFDWTEPKPFGKNGRRMFGESGDTVAQASFVYNKTSAGVVGYWYLTSAPSSDYADLEPVFAGLMKGVKLYGTAGGGQGAASAAPAIQYVKWQEPNEGAYVMEVPRGWQVRGGMVRPDPLRIQDPVEMQSPDGQVYAFSGDASLPLFKTPTQLEMQTGMREGSRNGVAVLWRYVPAAQYLPQYIQQRFGGQCSGLQIMDLKDQTELSGPANAQLQASTPAGMFQQLDVAMANFTCGSNVGSIQIATFISGQQSQYGMEGFGMWQVSGVAGFIAPEARAGEATDVVIKMLTSRVVNPQWAQSNQQMVAQITAISRDAAAQMSAQIARRYPTSSSSSSSSSSGSSGSVSDDLSRRWQNNTMDQVDVVDQSTGERYKVESGSNYYWINQQGTAIAGTNAPSQPTVDFQEMTQLP